MERRRDEVQSDYPPGLIGGHSAGHQSPCGSMVCPTSMMRAAWVRALAPPLVGDAIHPMTPDLGQGACQAIVDGTTLASCLFGGTDVPRALHAYRRSRYRNAAIATLFSRSWGSAGQLGGRVTCATRDSLVKAMPLSLQLRQLDMVIQKHINRVNSATV